MKEKNIPNHNTENNSRKRQKPAPRQIAAIVGIVILVLMYIITLIAAITDNSSTASWFGASLLATMALPLLLWIYIWMYGKLTGKSTIAEDPKPEETSQEQ